MAAKLRISTISETVLKNIAPELMETADTVYAQSDLNIEEIMKLEPDVILYNANNASHAEILNASGIPCVGFATVGASTEADPIERYAQWLKLLEDVFGESGKMDAFISAGGEIAAPTDVVPFTHTGYIHERSRNGTQAVPYGFTDRSVFSTVVVKNGRFCGSPGSHGGTFRRYCMNTRNRFQTMFGVGAGKIFRK